jgi:hypothetical protein
MGNRGRGLDFHCRPGDRLWLIHGGRGVPGPNETDEPVRLLDGVDPAYGCSKNCPRFASPWAPSDRQITARARTGARLGSAPFTQTKAANHGAADGAAACRRGDARLTPAPPFL